MFDQTILTIATALFIAAVIHTLLTKKILHLAHSIKKYLVLQKIVHFLGEVEVIFGVWAFILILTIAFMRGTTASINYMTSVSFTEAVFVFVIMCMTATRPVVYVTTTFIKMLAVMLPIHKRISFYCITLIFGPLLGSFITEPAAMTVVALLLKKEFYNKKMSMHFMYATLGLLFVNISVGGTLTNFAAPPVLMVSQAWGWNTLYMLQNFGFKTCLVVILSTTATAYIFRKEILKHQLILDNSKEKTPVWLICSHVLFICLCIIFHKYMIFFFPLFLIFMVWHNVTRKLQDRLKIRESLLVGFFLAGLVVLGGLQGWWLTPLLFSLSKSVLFVSSVVLTAFTDNAAITYLATLVPNLTEGARQALVAGAVAGGGLTVIANAPNPAGFGILNKAFGCEGISHLGLFLGALPYTFLAMVVYYFL
ncbi:MAG: putative Na+/H+ antiporter [Bdellovibrionota bacterium]